MEDRKRPAIGSADDLAPPSKRLAVNGSKVKDDAAEAKEEGWIEVSVARPRSFNTIYPFMAVFILALASFICLVSL